MAAVLLTLWPPGGGLTFFSHTEKRLNMISTFLQSQEFNFRWIDVLKPTQEELQTIASQHGLHKEFITDLLQPEHLPKYEPLADSTFFILRYYAGPENDKVDTIQGLTNKIAIFQKNDLIITIHLFEIEFLSGIRQNCNEENCTSTFHLLNRIVKAVLQTFERPATQLAESIDVYEENIFLKRQRKFSLSGAYHLKRKIESIKKVLLLSRDILERIDDPAHQDPTTRDTRDLYMRLINLYESMSDNTNQLLTAYFSIASQKTNEVIRVLTLFSVFFMPLTFIVGVYGMNFEFMPELHWKAGYPLVIGLMVVVTLMIYAWFRRKGWL